MADTRSFVTGLLASVIKEAAADVVALIGKE